MLRAAWQIDGVISWRPRRGLPLCQVLNLCLSVEWESGSPAAGPLSRVNANPRFSF